MKHYIFALMTFLATALIIFNVKYNMNLRAAETVIRASEIALEDLTQDQREEQKEIIEKSLRELGYNNVMVKIKEEKDNTISFDVNAYKYKYLIFLEKQLSYSNEI